MADTKKSTKKKRNLKPTSRPKPMKRNIVPGGRPYCGGGKIKK